jgi:maltooligosyltrehalose trehalohydrolase
MLGDRLSATLSFEALKLVAATVLLSPQVPMLFMGEEYGEQNPFQYFISHTDADLIKMVQEGRKKEFSYFNWQGDVPDPQSNNTFLQCKLSWDMSGGERSTLLSFYQHLISFRQLRLAMQGRKKENITVFQIADLNTIGLQRSYQSDNILILLNFEKRNIEFKNPVKKLLTMVLNSASFPETVNYASAAVEANATVEMQSESVLIFEM